MRGSPLNPFSYSNKELDCEPNDCKKQRNSQNHSYFGRMAIETLNKAKDLKIQNREKLTVSSKK